MICPKCGNYAADTANFCVYCGTTLKSKEAAAVTEKVCPACGKRAKAEDKFCIGCGTALDGSAAESLNEAVEVSAGSGSGNGETLAPAGQNEQKAYDYSMFMPGYKAVHEPPPAKSNFWLGFVLGLFAWIGALILYVIWKEDTPKKAALMGKGAIIGAVIQVVLAVLAALFFFAAMIVYYYY